MRRYEESELILNGDGSIFHLHLLPEHIADHVILVGDPDRVDMISSFFSEIRCKIRNREFYTITGTFKGKEITVISTGIGTDNIDIVINELDALVNIDLKNRTDFESKRHLTIFRIGTSGAIHPDIKPGTFIASRYALGFDGLLNFYQDRDKVCNPDFEKAFIDHTNWSSRFPAPYICECSPILIEEFREFTIQGTTISANGFYGPQGRDLRARLAFPDLNSKLMGFKYKGNRITNFEMEGSAIYGLSAILGHRALTICLIIANRENKEFLQDYKSAMRTLVDKCLNTISNIPGNER